MRIGPAPLIPAFPIRPDRQEVYPRALGQAFVGNPFLDLPDVKAKVPEAPVLRRAPESRAEPRLESTPIKPPEPHLQDLTAPGLTSGGPGISRPLTGFLLDVKA